MRAIILSALESELILKSDNHSRLFCLTDKGQKHFEQHHQFHLRLTEDIFACLSPEEQKIFAKALAKIINHI